MSKKEKNCLNCRIHWDRERLCEVCRWEDNDHPSLFYQITRSPEVLAKELVTSDCDSLWFAWVGIGRREAFSTREEAIAATVAKLKEVVE